MTSKSEILFNGSPLTLIKFIPNFLSLVFLFLSLLSFFKCQYEPSNSIPILNSYKKISISILSIRCLEIAFGKRYFNSDKILYSGFED